MNLRVDRSLTVAIPLSSIESGNEYALIIASVNTINEEDATWRHESTIRIEEHKRFSVRNVSTALGPGQG